MTDKNKLFSYQLLLLCFFFSGISSLVYQTAWIRQFAFVFGTSEPAVAIVLAAYMAGLALGSACAGKLQHPIGRPIRLFALLQLGIAASALLMPLALHGATSLHKLLFHNAQNLADEGGITRMIFYVICSFLILVIPTSFMGATLPILTDRVVRKSSHLGPRVSALYATNTAGAFIGVLICGFVLLPLLGIAGTILTASIISVAVFLAALFLDKEDHISESNESRREEKINTARHWVLPVIFIAGVLSFMHEVLWTRLLGHILGSSIYAFSTIIATFLAGISIGAAIASRYSSGREKAVQALAWCFLLLALVGRITFSLIDYLPQILQSGILGPQSSLGTQALTAAAMILPLTILSGATFPLAVRTMATGEKDVSTTSARVFAWNTAGGIVGALIAGFVALPIIGYKHTIIVITTCSCLLAIPATKSMLKTNKRLILSTAIILIYIATIHPTEPWRLFRYSIFGTSNTDGPPYFFGVGRSCTVLVEKQSDGYSLRSNGMPEAMIYPRGARTLKSPINLWLGISGSMINPEARNMLMIGLGGGVAVQHVPPDINSIDIIEIEPEIIEANKHLSSARKHDPLSDTRVHLVVNDARGSLAISDKKYDIVVSQPSHPWSSGASHLYTREFFEIVQEHLNEKGVLVQWMGARFVDKPLLLSIIATARNVFDNVLVYNPMHESYLFVAFNGEIDLNAQMDRIIAKNSDFFNRRGIFSRFDLMTSLTLDTKTAEQVSKNAELITDNRNLLAMRCSRIMRKNLHRKISANVIHDPLIPANASWDHVQIVRRLIASGSANRAKEYAASIPQPEQRAAMLSVTLAATGNIQEAKRILIQSREKHGESAILQSAVLRLNHRAQMPEKSETDNISSGNRTIAQAWKLQATSGRNLLKSMDTRLAKIEPDHMLFPEALRLRLKWRLTERSPALTAETIKIADMLCAVTGHPADQILYAEAAFIGEHPSACISTITDIVRLFKVYGGNLGIIRKAKSLLENLENDPKFQKEAQKLKSDCEALLRKQQLSHFPLR